MYIHKIPRVLQRIYLLRGRYKWKCNINSVTRCRILEIGLPGRGEIDKDTHFYEMEDPEVSKGVRIIYSTLIGPYNIESLTPLEASGSDNFLDHVPME